MENITPYNIYEWIALIASIKAYEKDSETNQKMIKEQDKLITNLKNENLKLEELHLYEIKNLNAELEQVRKSSIKNGRKKFWTGFATGTFI